jgi:hypothetical protein
MGQSGFAPARPNPVQQPPAKPDPPTRVQQRPDVYAEQSDPFHDSDAYADRYRDPHPHPARSREPDRHRDDPYDDRYQERDRDRDYDEHRYADRDRGDRFRSPSADAIGRTIQVLTALISLVFVLHVVFVIARANQSNGFVSFTYGTAKFFVLGLGDVFTPNDATIGVILNYGLAAVIYLVAGRIIARALKR